MSAFPTAMATDHLRRAAVRATWAHSVYDTQPWRLRLDRSALHLLLDRSRRLNVVDPGGRLMIMSMGCALFNARVSMARDGTAAAVDRMPSSFDPDLIATLRAGDGAPEPRLAELSAALETRYTDQRLFFDEQPTDDVVARLADAASAEGADLVFVGDGADREALTALALHADAIENLNPAYRAEVRAWNHGARDRTPALPDIADPIARAGALALLCTPGDDEADWLRAGEALERVLLEIAVAGYAARVLVQVTEVPSVRSQLRRDLRLAGHPHVLLRIGRAPVAPMPGRRRLVDVLVEPD